MLVKISNSEAFEMLSNKEKCEKVFFKYDNEFKRAYDYRWIFSHSRDDKTSVNLVSAEFYEEIED